MQFLINNLIVVGIFITVGVATFLYGFIIYGLLETTIIKSSIFDILVYSQYIIWIPLHFLLARAFLKYSGIFYYDIAAFVLIFTITVLFVFLGKDIVVYPEQMENPGLFLKGIWGTINMSSVALGNRMFMENYALKKLVYCISILVYLIAQYFGMKSKGMY